MSASESQSASKSKLASSKKSAGKTNDKKGSLVKVVVLEDVGKWISPQAGEKLFLSVAPALPEVIFQIDCDAAGPFVWEWSMQWGAKVSGLREKLPRGVLLKTFKLSGKTTTDKPKWRLDLNGDVLGGVLTVQIVVDRNQYKRSVHICGKNPEKSEILAYLSSFSDSSGYEKIIEKETKAKHFLDIDGEPVVAFDNGYGLTQLTNPAPSYHQAWNWKENIKAGISLYAACRQRAKKMLDAHLPYSEEMLTNETYARWNGGGYYGWDVKANKWVLRVNILCDSSTGNIGWNMVDPENSGKTEADLRDRDKDVYRLGKKGQDDEHRWQYSGICYADHLRNADE
ncbi:hypothetical protein [Azohydromonas lata]|uniref:Uncharacterized protein n=1 Tax=Azohydromonas lata TaxID=45677 RepID=A0ABU5IJU7_9BURK|nr:hypothetical protein [Azohydromonas lata]MDZ5459173.1 hypothetical protein [Azohydromonas lata]